MSPRFPLFENVPDLARLSDDELERLQSLTTTLHLPAGEVLMIEGAFGNEALILLEGALAVERDGEFVALLSPGAVVGEHSGFAGFTVGQRRGLGGGFSEPMFVLAVRPETKEVVVGTREELFGAAVTVRELNWLTTPPAHGAEVRVQLRYRAPAVNATIVEVGDELRLALGDAQPAITPEALTSMGKD